MKKTVLLSMSVWILSIFLNKANAQDQFTKDEMYVKTNIAVTKFKILGVTPRQYAKCLSTENYFEPEKTLKLVDIDKVIFVDDGQGYDLRANDGILTSTTLFSDAATSYLEPGSYRETSNYNTIVADDNFAYRPKTDGVEKFSFGCKLKWVRCSEMTNPIEQRLCNLMGWPYGGFRLEECHFAWN